jgi:NAD(P)-dependent dehydrogenase (short-subunit alcohol dehydrogenase family)
MMKTWLITGATGGLGQQLTKTVLNASHQVVATDLHTGEPAGLGPEFGDRVRIAVLDVTDPVAARAAVQLAVDEFGSLDVVVNSAGYRSVGSIEDTPENEFRLNIEINLFGVVNVTRAALPVLRGQRSGHIIQISTIGGRRAQPGLGAYQTSKWAVGGFSEILAKEVHPLGIRVTVIEPGGMRTPWAQEPIPADGIREDYQETVGMFARTYSQNPDVQRSDPEKVANVILRMTSEEEPPVRLPLGSDAAWLAPLISEARAAEDARWQHVSVSTDFDGLADFSETPVARMVKP